MKKITIKNRTYRVSARHNVGVDWGKSMPQLVAAIEQPGTQHNLDDPRFGCQVVGPFFGRDEILIVRAE